MEVRAQQYDTIEALCWRHLGVTAGALEETLKLNPKLAEYGPILPHGQLVKLPDLSADVIQTTEVVQLWD